MAKVAWVVEFDGLDYNTTMHIEQGIGEAEVLKLAHQLCDDKRKGITVRSVIRAE